MKGLVKKIVILTVSLILIVVACTLTDRTQDVLAGAGRGVNARIETISDFSQMLKDIYGATPAAVAEEPQPEKRYGGLTFHEFMSVSVKGEASCSVRRELTGYLSNGVSFTRSDLSLSFSAKSQSRKISVGISLKMEIYLDGTHTYLRLNRFIAGNSNEEMDMNIPQNLIGVWIDCSSESDFVSGIEQVNDYNSNVFRFLSRYVEQNFEQIFSREGSVYYLRREEYTDFMNQFEEGVLSQYGLQARMSGALSIDLSEPVSPKLTLTDEGIFDELSFRNIDNTVISLPSQMDIVSVEELEEMVG